MRVSKMTYPTFLLAIRFYLKSFGSAFITPGGRLVSSTVVGNENNRCSGYDSSDIYAETSLEFSLVRDLIALTGHDRDRAGDVLNIITQSLTTVDTYGDNTVQALDIRRLYGLLIKDEDIITVPGHDDLVKGAPEIILPDAFAMAMDGAISRSLAKKVSPTVSTLVTASLDDVPTGIKTYISICVFYGQYQENKEAILAEVWFNNISDYVLRKYLVE